MTREQIKDLQRRLQAEGLYNGPIDGVIGDGTKNAQQAYANRVSTSEARKAEAAAAAARATADAEKAKAEAEAIRLKAEADKRKADNAPTERLYQLGINVGAPLTGMVAGHLLAKRITAKDAAAQAARNHQLNQLAKDVRPLVNPKPVKGGAIPSLKAAQKARLAAAVITARKQGLTRVKGPLGLATAGLLLAEGTYSRFVLAPSVENETAAEALRSVGTASAFAATTLIGERVLANATRSNLPNAKDVATIEHAAKLSGIDKAAPAASRALGGIARAAGRLIVPVLAGAAAAAAYSSASKAGESTTSAVGKGAAAAGTTAADLVTGGAVSTFGDERKSGKSSGMSLVSAAVTGVGNLLTAGLASLVGDTVKGRPAIGYVPTTVARKQAGAAYLSDAAERRASSTTVRMTESVPATMRSDGITDAYARVNRRTGKLERVKSYRTPKR